MRPQTVIESNVYAEAARAVRAALKKRDEGEREAAAILRKQLDTLGEAKWLAWCEREFGWARSTAYRHLNPEQMERQRADNVVRNAMSRSTRHEPEEREPAPRPTVRPAVKERRLQDVLSPLTLAMSALGEQTRATPAATVVAGLQKQHSKGRGLDSSLYDEIVRLRDWLDELASGIKPLIVTCEVNQGRKGK